MTEITSRAGFEKDFKIPICNYVITVKGLAALNVSK